MAESGQSEMSRQHFQVAYDGDGRDAHSMDVQELGPALMSFGRLVREANAQLNGKRATVKVLVQSDFEHKCFNINFEVVQGILSQVATLLQSEEIKTARQILVDLGIITGSSGLGLLGFLRWKRGRKVTEVRDSDKQGVVIVQIGDGNVADVNRDALELSRNQKVRKAVEGALAPLGTDDISSISFKENENEVARFNSSDAKEIVASFELADLSASEAEGDDEPDTITAWLRVYSPVFDERAENWRFFYGDHPIYADVKETSIAKDADRGGSFVNDLYKVRMQVTQHFTKGGALRPEYKIIEVIDFRPAPQQTQMQL